MHCWWWAQIKNKEGSGSHNSSKGAQRAVSETYNYAFTVAITSRRLCEWGYTMLNSAYQKQISKLHNILQFSCFLYDLLQLQLPPKTIRCSLEAILKKEIDEETNMRAASKTLKVQKNNRQEHSETSTFTNKLKEVSCTSTYNKRLSNGAT